MKKLPIPLLILQRSDGKILFSSDSLEETLGWKLEKLKNRTFDVLFPHIPDRKHLRNVFNQQGCVRGEVLRARRRDGDEILVSVWQRHAVCNGFECVILMLLDVTAQKQSELELAERCKSLEQVLATFERQSELIGYEIHDGFVQEMVTALMHLDAYRWIAGESDDKAARELELTAEALRGGVEEARRLIDRVQPPDLEVAGLVGAVRQLVDRVSKHQGIPIDFATDLSFPRLPEEFEVAAYRIIQESLNNVGRHSQTPRAEVRLRDGDGYVELEVRDWGIGFDPASARGDHFGLAGIRHRTELLNGRVDITSSPGEGTRVNVRLPLTAPTKQPHGQ